MSMKEEIQMRVMLIAADDLTPEQRAETGPLTDRKIRMIAGDFVKRLKRARKKCPGYHYMTHGPIHDESKGY